MLDDGHLATESGKRLPHLAAEGTPADDDQPVGKALDGEQADVVNIAGLREAIDGRRHGVRSGGDDYVVGRYPRLVSDLQRVRITKPCTAKPHRRAHRLEDFRRIVPAHFVLNAPDALHDRTDVRSYLGPGK